MAPILGGDIPDSRPRRFCPGGSRANYRNAGSFQVSLIKNFRSTRVFYGQYLPVPRRDEGGRNLVASALLGRNSRPAPEFVDYRQNCPLFWVTENFESSFPRQC